MGHFVTRPFRNQCVFLSSNNVKPLLARHIRVKLQEYY